MGSRAAELGSSPTEFTRGARQSGGGGIHDAVHGVQVGGGGGIRGGVHGLHRWLVEARGDGGALEVSRAGGGAWGSRAGGGARDPLPTTVCGYRGQAAVRSLDRGLVGGVLGKVVDRCVMVAFFGP